MAAKKKTTKKAARKKPSESLFRLAPGAAAITIGVVEEEWNPNTQSWLDGAKKPTPRRGK